MCNIELLHAKLHATVACNVEVWHAKLHEIVACNVEVWHALLLSISERGTVSECDHSPTTFSRLLNAFKTAFSRI